MFISKKSRSLVRPISRCDSVATVSIASKEKEQVAEKKAEKPKAAKPKAAKPNNDEKENEE